MRAPVFRSVYRPELGPVELADVELCERCEGEGETFGKVGHWGMDYERTCPDCGGHRLVHGYDSGGRGLPVVLAGWAEEATAAPTGCGQSVEGSRRAPPSREDHNDDWLVRSPLPLDTRAVS